MAVLKELMGASTPLLVLTVLEQGPSYAYEIIRRINDEADGEFVWQEGTVYPLLHKLEKAGLIHASWRESESGRWRKYYEITKAGSETLQSGIHEWRAFINILRRLSESNSA